MGMEGLGQTWGPCSALTTFAGEGRMHILEMGSRQQLWVRLGGADALGGPLGARTVLLEPAAKRVREPGRSAVMKDTPNLSLTWGHSSDAGDMGRWLLKAVWAVLFLFPLAIFQVSPPPQLPVCRSLLEDCLSLHGQEEHGCPGAQRTKEIHRGLLLASGAPDADSLGEASAHTPPAPAGALALGGLCPWGWSLSSQPGQSWHPPGQGPQPSLVISASDSCWGWGSRAPGGLW